MGLSGKLMLVATLKMYNETEGLVNTAVIAKRDRDDWKIRLESNAPQIRHQVSGLQ